MTRYIKGGGIKVQVSPYYDCSCGRVFKSKAWALKHASTHCGTVTERKPWDSTGIGKIYLIDSKAMQFRTLTP